MRMRLAFPLFAIEKTFCCIPVATSRLPKSVPSVGVGDVSPSTISLPLPETAISGAAAAPTGAKATPLKPKFAPALASVVKSAATLVNVPPKPALSVTLISALFDPMEVVAYRSTFGPLTAAVRPNRAPLNVAWPRCVNPAPVHSYFSIRLPSIT